MPNLRACTKRRPPLRTPGTFAPAGRRPMSGSLASARNSQRVQIAIPRAGADWHRVASSSGGIARDSHRASMLSPRARTKRPRPVLTPRVPAHDSQRPVQSSCTIAQSCRRPPMALPCDRAKRQRLAFLLACDRARLPSGPDGSFARSREMTTAAVGAACKCAGSRAPAVGLACRRAGLPTAPLGAFARPLETANGSRWHFRAQVRDDDAIFRGREQVL
jgi:hypothetical protein